MPPFRTLLALLLLSPSIASAQLRFLQPAADLGELCGGPEAQHRFEFVNDSPVPLEIVSVRLGCGCLRPDYEKRIYQPGEKSSIVLHVRTLGQPNGTRTWQAYVQYRQGDTQHEATLTLAATLRHEVTVEPSILALSVETTLQQEVTITDLRTPPLKVTSVQASSPAIRGRTLPAHQGVTRILLEVRRADLTEARQEALLDIDTDDPHYRHLQVPVTLLRAEQAQVKAIPERVELHHGDSRLVRLRSVNEEQVVIERAEASHPALQCTWAAGPGNDATLRIRLNASKDALPPSANVRVQLRGPVALTVTIPVVLRKE